MGVKVAVVGGGSTYTPELVEGFVTRTDRLPVDELVLLDIDEERLSVVGALAERMMRRAGWGGTLRLTGEAREALEGADFVVVQLRVGGNKARYTDETIPLEFDCIGQETTGPGGFAKALRTVPVVLGLAELDGRDRRAGCVVRRLHEPDGARDAGAARSGPSRARALQRGDRVPAELRFLLRRDARPRAARARRAQPSELGAQGARRRRRPAARAPRAPRRRAEPSVRRDRVGAARLRPRPRRDPELLPALLLPDVGRARGAARGQDPRRRGDGDRGGPARAVQGPGPGHEAGAAGAARGRLLLRRGGGADRVAARRHRRRTGGERAEPRRDRQPRRRRRRRGRLHGRSGRRPPAAGRSVASRDASRSSRT